MIPEGQVLPNRVDQRVAIENDYSTRVQSGAALAWADG